MGEPKQDEAIGKLNDWLAGSVPDRLTRHQAALLAIMTRMVLDGQLSPELIDALTAES